VHLTRTGLAHHGDDLLGRGAAHDAVVNQDNPFATDRGRVRGMFELDAELADALLRLDEGATDVVVPDDTQLKRQG